jgi:hypothetical protein
MESDKENGVIYTGSDDGLVHVTRDGGKSWINITPKDLGEALVNAIEVSPHDPATVYVAAHKYKLNDFTPFAYKSNDYGKTWTKIVNGIPYGACVRVIREDDTRKGLLYAGTETGLFISYDDGANWMNFQRNLPVTPITDLKVHQNNLIAATQGRSFWVLDELQPIRSFDPSAVTKLSLLPIPTAHRISGYSIFDSNGEEKSKYPITTAANPATGAVMYYQLPDSVKSLTIEIKNQNGEVVRSFSNKPKSSNSNNSFRNEPVLTTKKGLNRFAWNLRRQGMPTIDNVYIEGSYAGRKIVPGTYSVTLTADGVQQSTTLVLKADPRINASAADFAAQDELLAKLEQDVTDIHVAVTRMRGLSKQIKDMVKLVEQDNSKSDVVSMGNDIVKKMSIWEEKLIQPKSQAYDDVINFVNKLSANIIFVHGELNGTIPYVTAGQKARYAELHSEWLVYKKEMEELLSKDVAELNAKCKALAVSNVMLPE